MRVPLVQVFAQQVNISAIKPILERHAANDASQSEVLAALRAAKVPPGYTQKVLRLLIAISEELGVATADDVIEAYAEPLISVHTPQISNSNEPWPVHYNLGNVEIVITENRNTLVQSGGTGYRTWEAALALVDWLLKPSSASWIGSLADASFIELGTGTGLVGMALAKLHPAIVENLLLTDGDAQVLARLNSALVENGIAPERETDGRALAGLFDWSDSNTAKRIASEMRQPRVVFAADVLYDPAAFDPFLDALGVLLSGFFEGSPHGNWAVVATAVRNEEFYTDFLAKVAERGLKAARVATYDPSDQQTDDLSPYLYFSPGPRMEILSLSFSGQPLPLSV